MLAPSAEITRRELNIGIEEMRRIARNGILPFCVYTWDEYRVNWHHRLIASKLDQFVRGEIKRLLISVPPQAGGKSELISRRLPAYIFGRLPKSRIIAGSYTIDLVRSMSRKCQGVMQSQEYQELFPGVRVGEKGLKSTDDEWETSVGGVYKGFGVEGGINGRPADFAILDDLIKGRLEANSPTIRRRVWDVLQDDVLTRIGAHGGCLIVATRWHEEDPTGTILSIMERDPEAERWETLFIPARLDSEEDRVPGDPRRIGESMFPWYYSGKRDDLSQEEQEKKASEYLRRWERINPLGFASLAQQKPTPLSGDMFHRDWFVVRDSAPKGMRLIRYWDRASTEISATNGNPDWTAGALIGVHDGDLWILDIQHFRADSKTNESRIRATAEIDGKSVTIYLEQEPGSSGKDVFTHYQTRVLAGFTVIADRPSGSKVDRARPWAALAGNRRVFILRGPWNHAFIAEAATFPNGKKDQIDAVSGGYARAMIKSVSGGANFDF